ncbi:hypothetical protein MTR67_035513 [Solanum verrucosum]|uniref:Ubiquitin-like protease family profile domain-containing protein n=1 Tax=Solanum verrucosum TaxID=315347 RepID=A0AAF0U9N0_SOLVR|nr:hypothetical protein MTR67_035513 [Solanum verrucosum]
MIRTLIFRILHPKINKGKEKVDTCSSPPKKKSRQTVTPIQKKTPPMIISKHPYLRKSPRHANVLKRPKSPLPKRKAKQRANVTSYTGIKQNVEIKSSVAFEIPSTNKSPDFSISRDAFEQFKISKVVRVAIPSFNSEVSIHQSHLQSPAGHSGFNPLGQQFNTPEPQMIHDDQSNLNLERSMVLHHLLTVDEHTQLPIPRERRPGPFNTSPYVTSFRSESGQYGGSIIEYINGYRMHVAAPWHTVDNILIHVNVKEIFHWIFIIVSLNDRCIQIYDSLSGGALHDSKVENEIKKYAQLIPMYLSKSGFYEKKDIDMSSHPKHKSHSEFDSFEMIYVKDIPQQTEGSLDCGLYVVAYADHISNRNGVLNSFDSEFTRIRYAALLWNYGMQKIQVDATSDSEAPERSIRINRDCDSSEKITIN